MATGKSRLVWTVIISLLIVIIAAGSVTIWLRYPRSQPLEIVLSSPAEIEGQIYIGGAVANPGIYPLQAGDRINDIIQAAGGLKSDADSSRVELYISSLKEANQTQKININRAEIWLLKALPGIGDVKAQAIVNYRNQNGLFRNTSELTRVEGISASIYQSIKEFITVSD